MMRNFTFQTLFTLAIVLLFGANIQAQSFAGGTGEMHDPFIVVNAAQFNEIRNIPPPTGEYPYVMLVTDIDCSSLGTVTPFDNNGGNLRVHVDGAGHVVSNLTIEGKGFCKQLDGSIKNLGFDNVTVTDNAAAFGVGVIAGHSWNGKITNCFVKNSTVTSICQASGIICGALMGGTTLVEDCYTENVTVTGTGTGSGYSTVVGRLNGHMKTTANFGGEADSPEKGVNAQGNPAFAGPLTGDTWNEATFSISSLYYASEQFVAKLAGVPNDTIHNVLIDSVTPISTGILDADLATEASYPGFDFDLAWKMGTAHPELMVYDSYIRLKLGNDTVAGDTSFYDVPFFVFGEEAGDTYAYSVNGGTDVAFTPTIVAATGSVTVDGLVNGDNVVEVKVIRGGDVVSVASVLIQATFETMNINELNANSFTIYPNPASDVLNISGGYIQNIQFYSVTGQLVKTAQNTNEIDIQELTPGIYFVRISNDNKNLTYKVIVE